MSIFAFYFASNLLLEMGWPRKLGRFKGMGYDAIIVDAAYAQSIDWGASLGAGRPRLSLQMIAHMFRDRDWEGDDAPNVKAFVEAAIEDSWAAAASPQEASTPTQLAERMSTISFEQFNDVRAGRLMDQFLLGALLWGLAYPDRFETWYTARLTDPKLPFYRSMGLEIDDMPSLHQFYEDGEQIVRDYEREVDPLPEIPPRLLADAKALGWRI
jgi:hypothetical protein